MIFPRQENQQIRFERESLDKQLDVSRQQSVMDAVSRDDQTAMYEREERSDLLKWQQDLSDEMLELIHTLKNEVKVEGDWKAKKRMVWKDGKPFEVKIPPLCNDKFIDEVVIPQCKPFLNRNLFNTNLTEQFIYNQLKLTMKTIKNAMRDNFEFYAIDFTNLDLVLRLIQNFCHPGIFRSLNGWNKKMDSTMFKSIETRGERMQGKEKKGIFGMFGG